MLVFLYYFILNDNYNNGGHMFNNYLLVEKENKKQLILFIDLNYEFSLFSKTRHKNIREHIKDYIKKNKISFKTGTILLVIGTVVIASLTITPKDILLKEIKEESIISNIETSMLNKTIDTSKKINKSITSESSLKKITKIQTKEQDNKTSVSVKPAKKASKSATSSNKTTTNKKNNTKANTKTTNKITQKTNTTTKKQISNDIVVTVYRSNGKIESINLENYVIGVVAAEMPASFNIEALKAQSILARTYALKSIKINKKLTDTVSTQAFIDIEQMKNKWGSSYDKYYNKIKEAVTSTKGMYITYNNEIIDAVYHSTSNGYTEDPIEVWGYSLPYLKVTKSEWDKNTSSYKRVVEKSKSEILKIFGITDLQEIKIISRNNSGRVSKVKIGNNTYTGVDIRTLLGLRSTDFDINVKEDKIIITTRGYGHGVGMSQYGSNEMAKKGYKYNEIINYYYENIKIVK